MATIETKCQICGQGFLTTEARILSGKGKYCSNDCRHKARSQQLKDDKSSFWKGGKVERICRCCGVAFHVFPSRGKAKFCSVACSDEDKKVSLRGPLSRTWGGGDVDLICQCCGATFQVNKAREKDSKFCSIACKAKFQQKEKVRLTCKACGVEFERYPCEVGKSEQRGHDGAFCSKKCYGDAFGKRQVGEANPHWKGGVTPENKRVRDSKQMLEWRIAVFQRDDYRCQHCGDRNAKGSGKTVRLHAHHIKGFAERPDLRFEVDNGLTLCEPCHYAVHRKP